MLYKSTLVMNKNMSIILFGTVVLIALGSLYFFVVSDNPEHADACKMKIIISQNDQPISLPTDIFTNIKSGDAHHWDVNTERKNIAYIKKTDRDNIPYRKLVELLIKSQTIATFDHIKAELCLKNESENDHEYTASFDGTHTYCTSECVDEKYSFIVHIDKTTGEIFITK